jgi:hypothetical protein
MGKACSWRNVGMYIIEKRRAEAMIMIKPRLLPAQKNRQQPVFL